MPGPTGSAPAYRTLIAARAGPRYHADWSDASHHHRRLVSEFIGTFGLVGVLSGGAAILAAYGHPAVSNVVVVTLLSVMSSLWLVVAIYALGDVSAHFNPAMTFAFALRGDMSWRRAAGYWIVQCAAAIAAAGLVRLGFGATSSLASVAPPPGAAWGAVAFEAVLTGGFVLMVLAISQGPKLNGPFTPLAVAAYIMAFGTMGGLYEGAAMNPARALGPDLLTGNFGLVWVYALGAAIGAVAAVALDRVLRGGATEGEAAIAESEAVP